MPIWILDKLSSESIMIMQAPWSFTIVVICGSGLAFLLSRSLSKFQMQSLRDRLDETERRLLAATEGVGTVKIKISYPANKQKVDFKTMVRGTVEPSGHPVQVLILADDKLWHPQKRATGAGYNWGADCWFGTDATPSGRQFTIVAMDGVYPITEPIRDLLQYPAASKAVVVYRK